MKKFLIIILLLIYPLPVNAGIICNDGWESSCIVSGPGCCSHHGGVDNGSEHQNVNINNYISNSDEEETSLVLILLILGLPIILGIYSNYKEKKEKEEQFRKKQEQKAIIQQEHIDYLEELWQEYLHETKQTTMNDFSIHNDVPLELKIQLLNDKKEEQYALLQNNITKYKSALSMIKNTPDDNMNEIGQSFKQEAINHYKEIFKCIFSLCVINDLLSEIDTVNKYPNFNEYRNLLFNQFGILDELLEIYRK